MTIEVQGPDGSTIEFPDGTDSNTITSVMAQNFGGPQTDTEANKGIGEKAFDALRYGAQQNASGIANTVGANNQAPLGATPYTPASEGLHNKNLSYWERAKYLPRAILESLPQGAQHALAGAATGAATSSLLGPEMAPVGALAGAVGSYALSNYGNDESQLAQNAGEDPNNPSNTTRARAIASSVAGGALSRLGLTSGLGTATNAVGKAAIPAVDAAIGKSIATNAAAAAANTEQHSLLVDGQQPSLDTLGTDAITGGAIGGALRATKVPGELNQAYKFSDFGPEFNPVADRFDGLDTSTPSKSFQAVKSVESQLKEEIKTQPDTQAHLNALEKQSGYDDDIKQQLNIVRTKLKAGDVVDPSAISDLGDTLGQYRQGANLTQSLTDYNNLNRMKEIGNFNPSTKTFAGGIAENPAIKPLLTPHLGVIPVSGAAIAGHTLLGLTGLGNVGAALMTVPAAQYGLRAATRGVDMLMGNRNPLDQFTSRFGGDDTSLPSPTPQGPPPSSPGGTPIGAPVAPSAPAGAASLPNFRDVLNAQKLKMAAQKQQAAASGRPPPAAAQGPVPLPTPPTSAVNPAAAQAASPPLFSVTHGDQTVTRTSDGVVKLPQYQAKISSALAERNNAIQDAHAALSAANAPTSDHVAIEGLKSELNNGSGMSSKTAADAAIEHAIHRVSHAHRELARHALRKHHLLSFHKDK